jgi:hypothetical protein
MRFIRLSRGTTRKRAAVSDVTPLAAADRDVSN